MRKLKTLTAVASAISAPLSIAFADGPYKQAAPDLPYTQPGRAIEVDAAVRYWNSVGTMSKDLFVPGNNKQQEDCVPHKGTVVRAGHFPSPFQQTLLVPHVGALNSGIK